MAMHYNSNFNIKFIVESFEREITQQINCFYDREEEIEVNSIELKECSKVSISLESKCSGSCLEVKNIFDKEGEYIRIYPGETRKLFEGENAYSTLIPGNHILRIKNNDKYFYAMYSITPRHVSEIQLQNLRMYVNNQISGLSYDINSAGTLSRKKNYNSSADYINLFKCYYREFKNIKTSIEEIMKRPTLNIEKIYVKGQNITREDSKTVRYKESHGGAKTLEIKKISTQDSKENIFIKNMIIKMCNQLRDIESNLNQCVKQIEVELKVRQRDYDSKEIMLQLYKERDIKGWEWERRSKSLLQSNISLNETKSKISDLISYTNEARKMLILLSSFLNSDFFNGIKETNTLNCPKLFHGNAVYNRFYKSFCRIKETEMKGSLNFKPSELLYEYFVLLNVIGIFKNMGYSFKESDMLNLFQMSFIDEIPEGANAVFEKEDIRVEIWYEQEILSLSSEALSKGGGFFTHAPNRLPDIRIDLYKQGKLVLSIVIEVKYRRYSYLWSDIENLDAMIQIKNYKTTIQFLSKTIEKPFFPVSKVIVVYPGQAGIKPLEEKDWGDYIFLQMKPGNNEDEISGYKELKGIIEKELENIQLYEKKIQRFF